MKSFKFTSFFQVLFIGIIIVWGFNKPVHGYWIDEESDNKSEVQRVCNVLLEPLQPGSATSSILEINCGNKSNLPVFKVNTTYHLASFFDKVNFDSVLIQYYGSSMCSSNVSYGVGQVSSSVDNRISSGSGFSGCNNIYVYDLANYAGDSASCFANCSSFGSLNDRVSSWKITN